MSYGKESSHTDRIAASMSQQMGNARRFTGGGKGGPPLWANQYRPTETGIDQIRLIPGQYSIQRIGENDAIYTEEIPWWECTEHFHGTLKKSAVCSGGLFRNHRTKKEPCAGCEIFWADWAERKAIQDSTGQKVKNPNRVSKSDRYIFHVLDLGYFFRGPDLDERGVPRTDSSGKQYTKWIKYDGSPMHAHLLGGVTKEEDKRWGRLLEWSMGREHFGLLAKYAETLGHNCSSCGGVNSIRVQRWACTRCHQDMFDQQSLMLPQQQLTELVNRPGICRNCQHIGYPLEVLGCTTCPQPKRASIFDVNFDLCAQVDQQTKSRTLCFMQISPPCGINQSFLDLLEKLPNLPERYAPTPYAEQMTRFNQGGPRDAGQQQAPFVPNQPTPPPATYGQNQGHQPATTGAPPMGAQSPGPQYAHYGQPAPVHPNAAGGMAPPMALPPGQAPQYAGGAVGQQAGWGNPGGNQGNQ